MSFSFDDPPPSRPPVPPPPGAAPSGAAPSGEAAADAGLAYLTPSTSGGDPRASLAPFTSRATTHSFTAPSTTALSTTERLSQISVNGADAASVLENLEDEIPQAKPSVTSHDRLWAELSALQGDVERAAQIHQNHGFLGTEEAETLAALRTIQVEFAHAIANEEQQLGLAHYKELWGVSDPEVLRTRIFGDRHLALLNENMQRAAVILDDLAALLEK